MKKIALPLMAFAIYLFACNGSTSPATETTNTAAVQTAPGGMSAAAQKNLDAVHVIDKAFETGDVSGVDAVVADNFVDHTERGDKNRDTLKAMIKMWRTTDKTMKMETTKEVADDEYVYSSMHITGTGDGVMMPSGPYDMHSVEVVKFNKENKAVEHWGYLEMSEVMKMMTPHPGSKASNPAEPAKKK